MMLRKTAKCDVCGWSPDKKGTGYWLAKIGSKEPCPRCEHEALKTAMVEVSAREVLVPAENKLLKWAEDYLLPGDSLTADLEGREVYLYCQQVSGYEQRLFLAVQGQCRLMLTYDDDQSKYVDDSFFAEECYDGFKELSFKELSLWLEGLTEQGGDAQ